RVTAPTSGILLPPSGESFPALGHQVEAGQVVARLEPPLAGSDLVDVLSAFHELEVHEADLTVKIASARAEAERARAELRLAEAELERARSLADAQAKSERELREAEFRAEAARIAVDMAERVAKPYEEVQELLEGHPLHNVPIVDHFPAFELRAPVSGTIDAVRGTHGESVVEGTVLFEIVDASEIFVEALVPESSVRSVKAAGPALVEVTLEDGSTMTRKLERVHVGWRVDDSRRVRVVYRATNDDGLFRAGEAVSVLVETSSASPRLSLPADAVVDDRGVPVVYVQVAGETFVRRPVELGIRSEGRVEIRKGIERGERAVVKGAYFVRAASFGDAIPDHHH
ncbi:MAG TPA: efflux RND transporter periplasmic adaptor subunit, partial [Planctomycetota bacterium]|nr:efflux RND transporter periplasmic adaptor subunit [Planctomycetota bacterium]